jgi:hypothetical protein
MLMHSVAAHFGARAGFRHLRSFSGGAEMEGQGRHPRTWRWCGWRGVEASLSHSSVGPRDSINEVCRMYIATWVKPHDNASFLKVHSWVREGR